MTVTPADYVMQPGDRPMPLLWVSRASTPVTHMDTSDDAIRSLGIEVHHGAKGRIVRSWGHNFDGVHWLLTRGGTPVHTDRAYLRYTHQIVLRNDGTRIRGHPRFDSGDRLRWPPVLSPGAFYCLDTHSPHQGCPDPRLEQNPARIKIVVAVDRDQPMVPEQAWRLLAPYLLRQITDDPMTLRPPRYQHVEPDAPRFRPSAPVIEEP